MAEYILAEVLGCVNEPRSCTTDLGGRAPKWFASQESVADKFAFSQTTGDGTPAAGANGVHGLQACGGRIDALLALG